ncbi:hypothetical protein FS837_003073 [Tulasnella sp. UAMH 9824]|nr:hypothetical protein FS837_003073 [Tulasnella sp. UAMH 9824]
MNQSFNRTALEQLADEAAAQAFGVGSNDLHSFITQKCESREGGDIIKALDALLRRLFQHRNRLLRLHLLPDEILLHIFKLAVDFDWTTDITQNKSIHYDLKMYYKTLYPIQSVSKRWHDIIVSYAPFWSLISTNMPENMLELALARAHKSTLSVGVQNATSDELLHFTHRLLPLADRVGTLAMDHSLGERPLWTGLPNIQNLQIRNMDDSPYEELEGSSQTVDIPSPRWISLSHSILPTVPKFYSQVEELTIGHISQLTSVHLKLIVESAPRLRILQLDGVERSDTESLDDPSSLAPMPNLQLLHISRAYGNSVAWLLNRFQLSPHTNLRIQCWDWSTPPYQNQIRDRIWAALHSMTDSSFSLELAQWTYRFQTRKVSIEIEIEDLDAHTRWPDFFDGFVPQAGRGPIRVYIFLMCGSFYSYSQQPIELPNEDCIKGLQNDSFFIMG